MVSFLAGAALMFAGKDKPVFPDPAVDVPAASGDQIAVLSGGCFWGVEGVYEKVKGVKSATAGYSGGEKSTAHYEMVSEGNTGHAESVQIKYRSQPDYLWPVAQDFLLRRPRSHYQESPRSG
jgi:peptide-methionine (S)-S-oxide reductase